MADTVTVDFGMPVIALLLAASLGGCAMPPDAGDATGTGSEAPATSAAVPKAWFGKPGVAYVLDQASSIVVRVYREGRLARFGHNHVVEVTGLGGELAADVDGGGVAVLRFRVDALRVDEPQTRMRAGGDFSSVPGAGAIEGTRRNMLGPQVLDAQTWPEIVVHARVADLQATETVADVHLGVRGLGRLYLVPVTIVRNADGITVSGSLPLRQTELGITPFSVMGGALRVRDRIVVDFRVVGRNSGASL